MRRLGVTLVLCLAAVAAVATAALAGPLGDPHREQERLNAADTALAKRITLRADDLAAGWRRTPVPPDDDELTCPGFDPDLSRFTITGKAESAFSHPGGAQVLSVVEVYATRAQAVGDFRAGARPEYAGCLRYAAREAFRRLGSAVTARVLSSRMVAPPRIGERNAAYRLVARITAGSTSVSMTIDVLAFQRGRSIAALMSTGVVRPVSNQVRIARALAARMR